ncbi:MAG: DNA primase [Oceanospirillaceae bacterium]|nr:DNA primase [Oceanospirillaceae bacterium]
MASKIPQSFIDDLLARTDIVDIIENRVNLKKTGKNYSGLCPFHKEKSPSFSVSPDKQFYYCFGCGAGGNAISFITEFENLPFPQAVEDLAKLAGLDIPKDNSPQRKNEQLYQAQFKALDLAAAFFQSQLKNSSAKHTAINYLKGRGLDGETAKRFGIGFAPPGWDNLIKALGITDTDQAHLERSGMLIRHEEKDSLYDRFRDRIMFPIRDMRGRVIAFGGRILGDGKPKYLNSPETDTFHKGRELYGLFEARKHNRKLDKILIVEGYMDVVSLAQFDINYSVATLGTSTSLQHLERLYKIVPEIIFCFDGDQAGLKAAKRALETVMPTIKDGQQAKFLFLPEGEDPDTLVREKGKQHFEEMINSATPMSTYFFNSLSENIDMESIDGRAIFSSKALPLIQEMQPSLLQQMMRDRISELTGLSIAQLTSSNQLHESYDNSYQSQYNPEPTQYQGPTQYNNTQERPQQRTRPTYSSNKKRTANISLVNRLISLILHNPQLIIEAEEITDIALINEDNTDVLALLVNYWQKHPQASLGQMLIDWQESPEHASKLLIISEVSRLNPCPDNNYNKIFFDSWEKLKERQNDLIYAELKRQKTSLKSNLSSEAKAQARLFVEKIAEQHKKMQ